MKKEKLITLQWSRHFNIFAQIDPQDQVPPTYWRAIIIRIYSIVLESTVRNISPNRSVIFH
jgi:hypothetical protein